MTGTAHTLRTGTGPFIRPIEAAQNGLKAQKKGLVPFKMQNVKHAGMPQPQTKSSVKRHPIKSIKTNDTMKRH